MGEERVGDARRAARAPRRRRTRSARPSGCRSSSRARRRSRRAAGGGAACRAASARATGVPGATDGAIGASAAAAHEHDRPRARREQVALLVGRARRAARARVVISANGLSSRCLRARSRATGRLVRRVAGEVVAAEPLDREDRSRRAAARPPRSIGSDSLRPAGGTARSARRGSGGRAGSSYSRRHSAQSGKPAIVVLRPVVRDAGDDREARPALRAVDERVAVAAIGRVEQLAQAVVAGRDVGGDQRRCRRARALGSIAKPRSPTDAERARRSTPSTRASGGASASSARAKRASASALALGLDHDAVSVVQHEPAEPVPRARGRRRTAGSRRPARSPDTM